MAKTYLVALLSGLALSGACKNDTPKANPGASRPVPPPPVIAGPPVAEAKALLIEDKLRRFATYQAAMVAATADATDLDRADQRGDAQKRDGAVAADQRAARLAALNQAALAKSGLSQDDATKLSRLVTPYYGRMFALQDRLKRSAEIHGRVEEANANGKQPNPADVAMDRMHRDLSARLEAVRKDFGERYGEEALALVRKHEPDFLPIHEKMVGPAVRGMPLASPRLPAAPAQP